MTRKERLMQDMDYAIKYKVPYFYVKIETMGNEGLEIIVNPFCNLGKKKEYYDNAYDDNLVLKSYNGIRIVSWDCFSKYEKSKYLKDIVIGDEKCEDVYYV